VDDRDLARRRRLAGAGDDILVLKTGGRFGERGRVDLEARRCRARFGLAVTAAG
jgi:hypothetical protein